MCHTAARHDQIAAVLLALDKQTEGNVDFADIPYFAISAVGLALVGGASGFNNFAMMFSMAEMDVYTSFGGRKCDVPPTESCSRYMREDKYRVSDTEVYDCAPRMTQWPATPPIVCVCVCVYLTALAGAFV